MQGTVKQVLKETNVNKVVMSSSASGEMLIARYSLVWENAFRYLITSETSLDDS